MVSRRRGHGEGSIYRRSSDGLWVGAITVGTVDGRQVRRRVHGRSRAAVAEKLRTLQLNLGSGLAEPSSRATVAEHLEHWLRNVLPGTVESVNTIDNYAWAIRTHLVPALGHRPLVKLSPAEVAEFLRAKIDAGMARNSVLRLRSVLVTALDHAILEGLLVRNVASLVRPPKGGSTPEGRALDEEQARAFLRAASGRRLEAAFVLMLMVGLRPGEVLSLEWPDLDADAGVLHVERSLKRERGELKLGPTKTKRSRRVVALPEPVLAALAAHRRRQAKERLAAGPAWPDPPLMFATSAGTLYDPSNFRREFNVICAAAGLGRWHPHELRHSAVSLLSASGVPLELVADVMGHQTTRTTEAVYRHTVLPAAGGAVEAMDRMFGDQPR